MGRLLQEPLISSEEFSTAKDFVVGVGWLGIFGKGFFRAFLLDGTFTVPDDITSIRVRCVGGGGGPGPAQTSYDGGGGGGYAHGVFTVTPGDIHVVTVSTRNNLTGGTTSFDSLIFATGGAAATLGGVGGSGVNGDFQANGGNGGLVNNNSGAGGAGSQLGNGGNGGTGFGDSAFYISRALLFR